MMQVRRTSLPPIPFDAEPWPIHVRRRCYSELYEAVSGQVVGHTPSMGHRRRTCFPTVLSQRPRRRCMFRPVLLHGRRRRGICRPTFRLCVAGNPNESFRCHSPSPAPRVETRPDLGRTPHVVEKAAHLLSSVGRSRSEVGQDRSYIGRCRPRSVQVRAEIGPNLLRIGRCRSKSATVAPQQPKIWGQTQPNLEEMCPKSAQHLFEIGRRNSAQIGQLGSKSATLRQNSAELSQHRSSVPQMWPMSALIKPKSPVVARRRPTPVKFDPNSADLSLVEFRASLAEIGLILTSAGQIWADWVRIWRKCGRVRPKLAGVLKSTQIWSISDTCLPTIGRCWSNLAQSW